MLDESVRELNCGHIFHTDCIVPWLEQHATCPVCRKPLTEDAKAHQERQEQEEGEDGGEGGPLGMALGGAASSAGVANIEIRNSTMNDLSRSANGQVIRSSAVTLSKNFGPLLAHPCYGDTYLMYVS